MMITVKVMVPHDHMQRYSLVELEDTADVRARIVRGYLQPVEVTDGRGDRLQNGRDDTSDVRG